jgi:hypothetical protein
VSLPARWIRLGPAAPLELRAAYAGLAAAQPRRGAPILLWARASCDFLHGAVRAKALDYVFVLIVPLRLAPGRRARWPAWGLAPAVAALRQFGLHAYASGADLWLSGRRIARGACDAIGECAVFAASLRAAAPGRALETVLRERVEAQHDWLFETSWPNAVERSAILEARAALVAQAEALAP